MAEKETAMTDEARLFDRRLIALRRARSLHAPPHVLAASVADELAGRLSLIARRFGEALLIAPDPRPAEDVMRRSGKFTAIALREPPEDDDLGLAPQSLDAVVSLLDLHAVNDVPGYLAQIARALRPDGLFLATLFAADTLVELRQAWLQAESAEGHASLRVAPMIAVRELGMLLQRAGFALPVADLDRTTVRYATALDLMREIKSLGLANAAHARSRRPVTRRLLIAAADAYRRGFADPDGRVRATVEIAWLTGWSPHESQQKPLKPGSATARLADALKVREHKLRGER
jgi:SAM-dependent methyltransferase